MGFLGGSLEWVNDSRWKKQWRSLFWRVRAAVKKASSCKQQRRFKFQYDPWSYALNFDDGYCCRLDLLGEEQEDEEEAFHHHVEEEEEEEEEDFSELASTWLYVLWVETYY